jgi:hypothetical protein
LRWSQRAEGMKKQMKNPKSTNLPGPENYKFINTAQKKADIYKEFHEMATGEDIKQKKRKRQYIKKEKRYMTIFFLNIRIMIQKYIQILNPILKMELLH